MSRREPIVVPEYGRIDRADIGDALLAKLQRFDEEHAKTAKESVFDWRYRKFIKARNYVGVIQIPGLTIEILPKLDDGDDDLGAAEDACASRVVGVHGVVAVDGQEGDVAPHRHHGFDQVGVGDRLADERGGGSAMKWLTVLAVALFAALPARAEITIKEVTSPGGITAWLVEGDSRQAFNNFNKARSLRDSPPADQRQACARGDEHQASHGRRSERGQRTGAGNRDCPGRS